MESTEELHNIQLCYYSETLANIQTRCALLMRAATKRHCAVLVLIFSLSFDKNSSAKDKVVIVYPTLNCGHSSVGRALASQAKGRGFESRCPLQREASVAQLVEQRTRNAQVSGSSPDAGSIFYKPVYSMSLFQEVAFSMEHVCCL